MYGTMTMDHAILTVPSPRIREKLDTVADAAKHFLAVKVNDDTLNRCLCRNDWSAKEHPEWATRSAHISSCNEDIEAEDYDPVI